MNMSMINSFVGMHTIQQKIDMIANNLANTNTVGFKSRELFFQDILSARLDQPQVFLSNGRRTPLGIDIGAGARAGLTLANFQQGQQLETGIATDLMLHGEDIFFTVVPPEKDPYEALNWQYTRNGHFQLDASRYLVTDQGDYLLSTDDEPIYIPEGADFQMDKQGRITVQYPQGETEEIGAVKLTRMITPHALEEAGSSKYQIAEAFLEQGLPVIDQDFDMLEPEYANAYAVLQGSLEGANIDFVKEMTQLTEAQRAYQFQARGLSIADQMMGIVNNLKG